MKTIIVFEDKIERTEIKLTMKIDTNDDNKLTFIFEDRYSINTMNEACLNALIKKITSLHRKVMAYRLRHPSGLTLTDKE